jgi:RimJ/RimL family protein N-acetyltransferase
MRTARGVYAGAVDDARVVLRPATADDFWLFERQAVDPDAGGAFNWSGYRDIRATRRRFDDNGLITPDGGCLVVARDGAAAGTVVWNKVWYGTATWWCWNIGISLLPEHRGKGVGTLAQRLLVAYLFDTAPVQRVEAYTDVENVAEQRALERAGFTREGVLRSTQFRDGRWRDLVMYAIVRRP